MTEGLRVGVGKQKRRKADGVKAMAGGWLCRNQRWADAGWGGESNESNRHLSCQITSKVPLSN